MTADHETSPTAWFWKCELALKLGHQDSAEHAFRKLERLRRRMTLEDRILGMLIQYHRQPAIEIDTKAVAELLAIDAGTGTHAQHLQRWLAKVAAR